MVELTVILDQNDRHCFGSDPELFVVDQGDSTKYAKRLCAGCPAKSPCLQYAIERPDLFGIWGGTTQTERKEMRGGRL